MEAQIASLIVPIGIFVVFYFLLIRPQQKKEKKIRTMRSNLKVGDTITTIGGINGKIIKIKEDDITVEVGADKVKLTMTRWSVGSVNNSEKNIDK